MVRQFAKIDIQLEVRATDNNQFQDKVRKGKHQVFWLGWNADYPDAENFLFLLYGPNSKSVSDGENTANYQNPEYDKLFAQLKMLDDGPEKQAVIDKMVTILQQDAPWSFGFYPWASAAVQSWVKQLQAGDPDPRPRPLPAPGRAGARGAAGAPGTSRCGGRSRCCWRRWRCCVGCWRRAQPAQARAHQRARRSARRLSPHAELPRPPHRCTAC